MNREGAQFCDSCGRRLPSPDGAEAGAPASPGPAVEDGAAGPPAQAPVRIGGRYVVGEYLGRGGRKDVFRARDEQTGDDVALALFDTEGMGEAVRARAQRELRAMERLGGGHPHLVAVLDTGIHDRRPYVVSSYMPGGDVAQLLESAEGGRLPVKRALQIAIDVCRALEHAHGRAIVHRDLKPANVWLGDDGSAYLGDFGLASTGRPRSGVLVGTVSYLPPEQALGRPAGPSADLYSLGAMLYEMLAGRPPFLGDDAVTIIGQHLNADPIPPSRHNAEVTEELDRVVIGLLEKDPADRPGSASLTRERLEAALEAPAADPSPTPPPDRNPLEGLAGGVFVGRDEEIASLRSAADAAIAGSGRLVLLGGEPGIGKTRLAEEIATYARLHGAGAHWGYCQEGDGAPAYWPWVQAIRSYVLEAEPEELRNAMGTGVEEIARLVPEAAERVGAPQPQAVIEDEQDRHRLFDAISSFLMTAAAARPLVIALDDLHWADEPSLLLLRFMATELPRGPLMVIGTYRDVEVGRHHSLQRILTYLSGEEQITRLGLRGLGPQEVARYVEMTVGPNVPAEFSRAVYEQTEGNPFFVAELVRLMASEGSFEDGAAVQQAIPEGVRDVIGRRLDHLSPQSNDALRIGAVIGRDFDRDVLVEAADGDPGQIDSGLAEAEAARLIQKPALGRYRFSHPLVQETLYEEIGPSRRPAVHARIAEALERLYSTDPARVERRLAELAHHYSLALAAGDTGKAVEYSERAGRQAISRFGYEEGAEHFARALEALNLSRPDPDRRCTLMLALGVARLKAGHPREGRRTLEQAAKLAEELEDPDRLARAALGVARTIEHGVPDPWITDLLERALASYETGDSSTRARLTAALAEQIYWNDPRDTGGRAVELHREAVAMARRLGEDSTLARTLSRAISVDLGPGAVDRRVEMNSEVIELARRAGDLELEMRAHMMRLRDHVRLGEMVNADRDLQAYSRLATSLRQPQHLWPVPMLQAMRAMIDGRMTDAERLIARARDSGSRAEEPLSDAVYATQSILLYRWQRRLGEIAGTVRDLASRTPPVPAWKPAEILVDLEMGETEAARRGFEGLAEAGFATIPLDGQWLLAHAMLAEAAYLLDDGERAEEVHAALLPYRGQTVVAARAAVCWGPVDRVLGMTSAAAGNLDRAAGELEDAVAYARSMGDRPFIAESELILAQVLARRRGEGDRAGAMELIDDTLSSAQEMEMRTITERALELKLGLQGLSRISLGTSIDEIVSEMETGTHEIPSSVTPGGTITILFSDIEDSTVMIERLGDARWLELLRSHNRIFRRMVSAYGGHEVKNQGDGFMLSFADSVQALRCAVAVQREFDDQQAGAEPSERIRVRMGLHTGEAIEVGGDFYGRNVVIAARIANHARGGEILASSSLVSQVERRSEFGFGPAREVELKGLSGTQAVHPVEWQPAAGEVAADGAAADDAATGQVATGDVTTGDVVEGNAATDQVAADGAAADQAPRQAPGEASGEARNTV